MKARIILPHISKVPYDTLEDFAPIGGDPVGNTPHEFAAFLCADYEKNGAAARQARLKID